MVRGQSPAVVLAGLVEGVTAKWAKQRRSEERDANARARRNDRLIRYQRPMSLRQAAFRVLPQAFAKASDEGKLPANARQIYYAARPEILRITGKENLDSQYFCQTLLIDFMQEFGTDWDMVWDDRGHFTEPHGGERLGLGTLAVRHYLRNNAAPVLKEAGFKGAGIKTHGPEERFGAVLFIEKEGFTPIFNAAALAERFDIAIMSSKGMSVTAARMLADRICAKHKIPLLTLHDFDIAGFSIGKTVGSDTRRYTFQNKIKVIDLGLRLADIDELNLESEAVSLGNVSPRKIHDRLRRNGASTEEIDFLLSGRRVELNAMTSDRLVEFVESKLIEYRVTKVIPAKETLAKAFRLFARSKLIEAAVEKAIEEMPEEPCVVPDDLDARVKDYLDEKPESPWEEAIRHAVTGIGGAA
jgi:hypothetical protein